MPVDVGTMKPPGEFAGPFGHVAEALIRSADPSVVETLGGNALERCYEGENPGSPDEEAAAVQTMDEFRQYLGAVYLKLYLGLIHDTDRAQRAANSLRWAFYYSACTPWRLKPNKYFLWCGRPHQ